jgi:hypothetical protein
MFCDHPEACRPAVFCVILLIKGESGHTDRFLTPRYCKISNNAITGENVAAESGLAVAFRYLARPESGGSDRLIELTVSGNLMLA